MITKIFFTSYLIRGDTLVLDRWRWIKKELPKTCNGETVLDIGCGSGAFTLGAALRGYSSLGLSWDKRNQQVARQRADKCKISNRAKFEIQDVRSLQERPDLAGQFDVCFCCECAEHILDDRSLFVEMAKCLKPGGRLLFTAPNFHYNAISTEDLGPFSREETGWHVRRGYSPAMLRELCRLAGFEVERIDQCSGFFTQKVTGVLRFFQRKVGLLGWFLVFPLRVFALLDWVPWKWMGWPNYSICLVAVKPRWERPFVQ
ncbi:class I SAM-dependent methyltransferase [bacterium]|nr:class I SAM-dependent methyltransferase [bacterium]